MTMANTKKYHVNLTEEEETKTSIFVLSHNEMF